MPRTPENSAFFIGAFLLSKAAEIWLKKKSRLQLWWLMGEPPLKGLPSAADELQETAVEMPERPHSSPRGADAHKGFTDINCFTACLHTRNWAKQHSELASGFQCRPGLEKHTLPPPLLSFFMGKKVQNELGWNASQEGRKSALSITRNWLFKSSPLRCVCSHSLRIINFIWKQLLSWGGWWVLIMIHCFIKAKWGPSMQGAFPSLQLEAGKQTMSMANVRLGSAVLWWRLAAINPLGSTLLGIQLFLMPQGQMIAPTGCSEREIKGRVCGKQRIRSEVG